MTDKVVDTVIRKYLDRSQVGIFKYGTTLEQNNKDNYLVHLQQELMDATLYLEKLLSLSEEITMLVNLHGNDADLGAAVRNLVK